MVDFSLDIATEAAKRWKSRVESRNDDMKKMAEGGLAAVESPERVAMNIERLTEAIIAPAAESGRGQSALIGTSAKMKSVILEDIARERIIGEPDFLGAEFLEKGLAVARFVGRVNIRSTTGVTRGFGTGFMVSPRLLITNNHVLENAASASFSHIEFDYQRDRRGLMLPVSTFRLQPDVFFMTDKALDYTIVAVNPTSFNNQPLSNFAWSRLIVDQGKILITQPVNIIQHPRGEIKQIVLRKNELIDILPDFAHYAADTQQGSSGACVCNDLWEVVALHHSGVPDMDQNGNILTNDGSIFTDGMDPETIRWVANEGVRVSSIVNDVKSNLNSLVGEARDLCEEMLNKEAPNPLEIKEAAQSSTASKVTVPAQADVHTPKGNGVVTSHGEAEWTIPLHVTVKLGPAQIFPEVQAHAADGQAVSHIEEAVTIDPNYGNRKGYNETFLGKVVKPPVLSESLKFKAAVNKQPIGDDPYALPYHHFSIVMNKDRGLAFYTAVNIDGRKDVNIRREKDKWFYDPRIDRSQQIGEDLYSSNPLDRGHLVRRLDPAWGKDFEVAKVANDDTFHFTNCSPQHQDFNQSKKVWAGLEDYLLQNANNLDLKISVFSGPVFRENDQKYRKYKLPREFWKVAVMVKKDKTLSATAYLLSQEKMIDNLESDFVFGAYSTYQTSIEAIENLTDLDFQDLKAAQPATIKAVKLEESVANNELTGFEQIRI
jgi:endonuclease G